jgi:uncharacterized membrane protein
MAAAAFNRCILAGIIDILVAILAEFVCGLFKAVDIRIAYILGMAAGAFINHHDPVLGMMANGAGIGFLVLPMRKICRFSGFFGLQSYICRTNAYLNTQGSSGDKE